MVMLVKLYFTILFETLRCGSKITFITSIMRVSVSNLQTRRIRKCSFGQRGGQFPIRRS